MNRIAFIFPGQGSQYTGMGSDLVANFAVARTAFEEADEALGFKLSNLCFEGPDEKLQLTANTQPAILATSIAAFRVLSAEGIKPDFVAGHSLGEYSALVAANALSLADAVRLVRQRGELMQVAVPVGVGAMAAIIGLEAEMVANACAAAAQDEICAPANFNTPTQTVIAGHKTAIERAIEICKAHGARRAVRLNVSAPFHCALMQSAQEGLIKPLAETIFRDPDFPLVDNVDAVIITNGNAAREGLIRQVSSPVRWTDSITQLLEQGVVTFIEVGPGKVLSGLVKMISREAKTLNVSDTTSLQMTIGALR